MENKQNLQALIEKKLLELYPELEDDYELLQKKVQNIASEFQALFDHIPTLKNESQQQIDHILNFLTFKHVLLALENIPHIPGLTTSNHVQSVMESYVNKVFKDDPVLRNEFKKAITECYNSLLKNPKDTSKAAEFFELTQLLKHARADKNLRSKEIYELVLLINKVCKDNPELKKELKQTLGKCLGLKDNAGLSKLRALLNEAVESKNLKSLKTFSEEKLSDADRANIQTYGLKPDDSSHVTPITIQEPRPNTIFALTLAIMGTLAEKLKAPGQPSDEHGEKEELNQRASLLNWPPKLTPPGSKE